MYSLAFLTFDANYSQSRSIKIDNNSSEAEISMALLWECHEIILRRYEYLSNKEFDKENFDQFGIYFEMMRSMPNGAALVFEICGCIPRITGPSATVPSRLHAFTVHAMLKHLHEKSEHFSVFNEFSGLRGVFSIDSAVYFKDKLIALVEIDGEFHYKQLAQQLRRKDQLKELLYRIHYPSIPLYRMRSDQIRAIGIPKAGYALAHWIANNNNKNKNNNAILV
jgi:hypothetical protein